MSRRDNEEQDRWYQDKAEPDPEAAVRGSPGRRTLTMRLSQQPAAVERSAAPVQRVHDAAMTTSRDERSALSAYWIHAAARPDLCIESAATPTSRREAAAVQMRGGEPRPDDVQRSAADGITGSGSALPFLDRIQRSFGAHDVSGIHAHTDDAAAAACRAMGAMAYATGDHVVFRDAPDLHTAAHEAAHVVQQRAGVQLSGGVGAAGDPYEQHAEQVAARVTQGLSSESLLDAYAGSASRSAGGSGVLQARTSPQAVQLAPEVVTDLEKLKKALQDDKENESIEIIGRLSDDEVGSVLRSAEYKALAVSSYNNDEMYRAMKAAGTASGGGYLVLRLTWMFEEGTSWKRLQDVIGSSKDRATIFSSDALRDAFVSELNDDEMAALVDLAAGSLKQKLLWMRAEGSNWKTVRAKIVAETDQAARAALYDVPGMVELFTDVCNNVEMADAVELLGGTLLQRLTWMKEEGSDWKLVRAKVAATSDATQRTALYSSPAMLDLFMDVCGNTTMRDAVQLLGGALKQKLSWMVAEGTDIDLVSDVVRNAPKTDLAGVSGDPTLMGQLKSELSGSGFATLQKMLTQDLLWQGEVVGVSDIGTKHDAQMAHTRSDVQITKKLNFVEKGTFGSGGFAAMKTKAFTAITTYLDNKFKVKIEPKPSGAPSVADGVYPLRVSATDDSSGTDVKLVGGEHGRSNAGKFYELGQGSETTLPDITFGHEMAHVILGAPDEYADPEHPTRTVMTDHSLMGDFYTEGAAGAQIKDRHFTYLIKYIEGYYPDRKITIVP